MLSQTEVRKIKLLDQANLVQLLADIDSTENYTYEFKAKFYSGRGCNEECRKDFSAFANYLGGFIFIGVDNSKNICGDKVVEIHKQLDEKLRPLGRYLEWYIIKTIDIGNGKYVYAIAIEEVQHYWEKPLISDSIIYIRGNGCVKPLNAISDAPNSFVPTRFLPTDIRYFKELLDSRGDELERWSTAASKVPMHYARIFTHCDAFLENEYKNTTSSEIKENLKKIIESFKRWEGSLNSAETTSSIVAKLDQFTIQDSRSEEIRSKLIDFIEKFNRTYKYE